MRKLSNLWTRRVFRSYQQHLEKTLERHQKGKRVNLSPWGTSENLEWVILQMKHYLENQE